MTKYILVGGYIHRATDGGKAFCEELIKGVESKPVKILDCMFARSRDSWEEKIQEDTIFFSKFIKDFELELAQPEIFVEQVKRSDVIFLRGGETRPLIDALSKDPSWIQELNGKVLAGSSAGGDVIAKYYAVGKTGRTSGEGLGLLNVKFIPHWESDTFKEYGISWDELLKGLKEHKENLPVYTVKEGEFKTFEI